MRVIPVISKNVTPLSPDLVAGEEWPRQRKTSRRKDTINCYDSIKSQACRSLQITMACMAMAGITVVLIDYPISIREHIVSSLPWSDAWIMRLSISLCPTISTCTILVASGYFLVAADIAETICIYQRRLTRMAHVPPLAVRAFNNCDSVTTASLLYLFSSNTSIQFLKDVRLLPADRQCPSSHADVRWCPRPGSIRRSSITGSLMTLMNIILLWYCAQASQSYYPS